MKGGSSRQPAPRSSARRPAPESSARRPRTTSGRARPGPEDDEGASEASMIKKVMFYGSGALFVIMIILVIFKWGAITADNTPPPKPKAIDHGAILKDIDQMGKDAAVMFNKALKEPSDEAKVKGIRAAMEKLSAAIEKLDQMSNRKEYRGEDFDQVFEPMMNRMTQEMTAYRLTLKRYM
jgi:hypothetical protein